MNELTKQLIKELSATTSVAESRVMQLFVKGLEVSANSEPADIFEQALIDLEQLNEKIKDEEIDTVVKKFKGVAKAKAKTLKSVESKLGVLPAMKKIKESGAYSDPICRSVVDSLDKALSVNPESALIETVVNRLKPFSFDPTLKAEIEALSKVVLENKAELAVLKTIYSLRAVPNQFYMSLSEKIETALVEEKISADYLKMQLSESIELPAVKNLINTLSQLEGAAFGNFNLGEGAYGVKINPVVGLYKRTDEGVVTVIDKFVLGINESSEVPSLVNFAKLKQQDSEFAELIEAFIKLGFTPTTNGIVAKGKANSVSFTVNEKGELECKINDSLVEDFQNTSIYDTLKLESIEFKTNLSKVLSESHKIAQFEFVQSLSNGVDQSYAINTSKSGVFVLDSQGLSQYDAIGFHKYVAETYKYDISSLYAIELNEKQEKIKKAKAKKEEIVKDIKKLEESISQLDAVMEEADDLTQDQLEELKRTIQSNIVSLKSEYLTIEESLQEDKKKV